MEGDTQFRIATNGNRVSVFGPFQSKDLRRVLAAAYHIVAKLGFKDLEFDFSNCTAAYSGSMLGLAAYAERYLVDGVDVDLVLPSDRRLQKIFQDTNWAHLIDPRRYSQSEYSGLAQIPAIKFRDGKEQFAAVQTVVKRILSALTGFDRSHLKAIEWSVNEITDNVINHANSAIGGMLQVTNYARSRRIVFTVSDAGIGIPDSLRQGHKELREDHAALDRAIREGVTRDTSAGQGNGLYGSWRISQLSRGDFEIHSGYASLISSFDRLHVRPEPIPFHGSLVTASIKYDLPLLLEDALRFRGKPHEPTDLVQLAYEEGEDGFVIFPLAKEAEGLGSRAAGLPIRQKLANLSRICEGKKVVIDFADVAMVSSSFADEVFGKLFVELGPLAFMRNFEFRRIDPTIQALIDRAINQRQRTGL